MQVGGIGAVPKVVGAPPNSHVSIMGAVNGVPANVSLAVAQTQSQTQFQLAVWSR